MMMGYQLYEVERVKSVAEQRAADTRLGEVAAAISRSIRAMRPHFSRSERTAACAIEVRPVGQA